MVKIVGAGLVGSLWAVLLRRQGLPVEIFEKRSDPRRDSADGGRSINLVVTSRGVHGLERAGLLEKLNDLAVPVYGRMIHPKKGDLVYQPYGQAGECNLSVSRAALNRFLIDEAERAGAKVHFNRDFESPADVGDFDVLFGADGAGSRVRKWLARENPAEFRENTQWLEADYKELTLPLGREGLPQLRTDALHIWPRGAHMMMALANRDGSFTVTLYLPKHGPVSFDTVKTEDDVRRLFAEEFPDAVTLMPDAVREFMAHPQGTLGTVRTSHWVRDGKIALMGDAAHAIVPFFGQGMNAGFEDCTTLLACWTKHKAWSLALADYERTQKPNADAIADMALENWVEMKEKVADPKFQFRKKVESALEQKFPGLFKSRYGLITYTLTPYAIAQAAGREHDRLFAQIIGDASSLDQIDWERARALFAGPPARK